MVRPVFLTIVLGCLVTTAVAQQPGAGIDHRVWLTSGAPSAAALQALRSAGVSRLALPVGRVSLQDGMNQFALSGGLPERALLADWSVTPVVWIEGAPTVGGDPAGFANQLVLVQKSFARTSSLILVATGYTEATAKFAMAVAKRLGHEVELCLPAADIVRFLPPAGWNQVIPLAVVFGRPSVLGFPVSTLQDDSAALDGLDSRHVTYRAAVIVNARSIPPPGPSGGSLATLANPVNAEYRPSPSGDFFVLRQALDWGGVRLAAGQTIEVQSTDAAQYHRDLGFLLRQVRNGLVGWDTIGLPRPEPTLGMSLEAFVDYFNGGLPYPLIMVQGAWLSPVRLSLTVENSSPYGSALSRSGNWVEINYSGAEMRDAQLGQFTGIEYGRYQGNVWRRTVGRDATAVRLLLTYIPPRVTLSGAQVDFMSRPGSVHVRWGLRLSDGRDIVGPLQILDTAQ